MQTIVTSFKRKAIHTFRFWGISLVAISLLQSCCPGSEIAASLDCNHQTYSGEDEYSSHSSSNDGNIGANLAYMLNIYLGGGGPDGILRNGNFNPSQLKYGTPLLASHLMFYPVLTDGKNGRSKKQKASDFSKHILFNGGIELIQKRSKDDDTKINLYYLQVPLYILYQAAIGKAGNIFGGLGPYLAYGIGGKIKFTNGGQTTKTDAFDKTSGFKPFDAGLGFTGGYKIPNSFRFSLAYGLGLADISRSDFAKVRNRTISLNIGYPVNQIFKSK